MCAFSMIVIKYCSKPGTRHFARAVIECGQNPERSPGLLSTILAFAHSRRFRRIDGPIAQVRIQNALHAAETNVSLGRNEPSDGSTF